MPVVPTHTGAGGACPHACTCASTRPRRTSPETAFTLIEMIVACVLFAIVAGVVVSLVIDAIGTSGGARSGAISDAAAARTTAALRDDLAVAQTEDRAADRLRDPDELARAVRTGSDARSMAPGDGGRVLVIDDVVVATPTELQLRADVHRTAGVECVTWRAGTTGANFTIQRLVGAACGSGSLESKTLVSAPAASAGLVTQPFSYDLICDPADCAGSRAGAGTPCRPWRTTGASGTELRWIVGVDLRLSSVAVQGSSTRGAKAGTSGTIRSRDTASYRAALGC